MALNELTLFSNVRITRDYSVVQDLAPEDWYDYLTDPNTADAYSKVVHKENVNYYRLPDVIRVEGNYDTLRTASYGCLKDLLMDGNPTVVTSFKYLFFWVDSVRLVRQRCATGTDNPVTIADVVELEITPDVWSTFSGSFTLRDSFVVRKHVDRWTRRSDPDDPDSWLYDPKYYPNAADDVGGAYASETIQDLTPPTALNGTDYDLRFIVISILEVDSQQNLNGKQTIAIGASAVYGSHMEADIYLDHANGIKLFKLDDVMDGSIFDALNISAEFVQSITVTPYISALKATIKAGLGYLYIDGTMVQFSSFFDAHDDGVSLGWVTAKPGVAKLYSSIYGVDTETVDPKAPEFVYDGSDPLRIQYNDKNEPMLFRSPARMRKVVTGMGGSITDVPDIDAFEDTYTSQNMIEVDQGMLLVYGGTDVEKANVKGNVGSVINASLPIFTSAWKSYQAIQKAGDDIAFNAQQVSTIVGTVTGAGAGAVGGAIAGAGAGPAGAIGGAVMGSVGGVAQGITRYWANSENLRARRETVKNSPCVVKSGGSGLTAYIRDFIDVHYVVMKLDDVSFSKLRTQYYYYGYNVNMVMPGTVSYKTRKYFDYVETRGAIVSGELAAEDRLIIQQIFDRGVRVYHGTAGYELIGAGMNLENPEAAFLE